MSVHYTDPNQVTGSKVTSVPWHGRTVSGYGGAIPTRYLVRYGKRWHRVKMMQYSNAGSAYITVGGADLFLDTDTEHSLTEA